MKSKQVPFNKVRWRFMRDCDVMSVFFKKVGADEWAPCWGKAVNKEGETDIIEARKGLNEYNVSKEYPNGSKELSRFSGGQVQWSIETDEKGDKTFTSDKGVISHIKGATYDVKLVFRPETNLIRETIVDKKANKVISQKMVERSQLDPKIYVPIMFTPQKVEYNKEAKDMISRSLAFMINQRGA